MTPPGGPPPGWYPNPSGTGPARWWDGGQWGPEQETPVDTRSYQVPESYAVPAPVAVAPPAKRPRKPSMPMIFIGIALALVGVLIGVLSIVMLVRSSLVELLSADAQTTPSTFTVDLEEGEHTIYADRRLALADIEVRDDDGERVDVRAMGSVSESVTIGNDEFTGQARFDADDSEQYEITIDESARVIVAESFQDLAVELGIWIVVGVVALLVMLVGAVLILVGALRREKAPPVNV